MPPKMDFNEFAAELDKVCKQLGISEKRCGLQDTGTQNGLEDKPRLDYRARFKEELDGVEKLLETLKQRPLIPDLSLEKRLDLANTLAKDENINYLEAQIQLRKPIADEIAPWESDPALLEWLEADEAAHRAEQAERERLIEEANARLREAEQRYEEFVESKRQPAVVNEVQPRRSSTPEDSCQTNAEARKCQAVRLRRSVSRDDINRKASTNNGRRSLTKPPPLRRRATFLADTSQSQIEVHMTCSNCLVDNEGVIHPGDLAAVVTSDECSATTKVVTSTPHVGKRTREMLFNDNQQPPVLIRRPSSVHFEDEKASSSSKNSTFEIENAGEKENRNPESAHNSIDSNQCANRTVIKGDTSKGSSTKTSETTAATNKANTTIVKERPAKSNNPTNKVANGGRAVPRIPQPRIGAPTKTKTATTGTVGANQQDRSPTRRPAISSITSKIGVPKSVLPSKTSTMPTTRTGATGIGRPLGVSAIRDAANSGSTRTGLGSRPSKPATASTKAPQAGRRVGK